MAGSPTARQTASTLPALTSGPHRRHLGLISIVACFGGLLFGYDTGVSNGAERPMQAELGLSDLSLGVVVSSLIFAAAVGALVGGQRAQRLQLRGDAAALAQQGHAQCLDGLWRGGLGDVGERLLADGFDPGHRGTV